MTDMRRLRQVLIMMSLSIAVLATPTASLSAQSVNPTDIHVDFDLPLTGTNVTLGTAEVDDLLLLSYGCTWTTPEGEVSSAAIFLVRPDESHLSLVASSWGYVLDMAGEWTLRCQIDGPYYSGSLDCSYELIHPTMSMDSPANNTYTTSSEILVSGSVDPYASQTYLSTDDSDFSEAALDSSTWSAMVQLSEGENLVYLRSRYVWNPFGIQEFWAIYEFGPYVITSDSEEPSVTVDRPGLNAHIRGSTLNLTWSSSDSSGIAMTEISVDGDAWIVSEYAECAELELGTGEHTVRIRVTDLAGNQQTVAVTFSVDNRALSFGGPYYGIPIVGMVLAIIAIALVGFVRLRRR